MNEYDSIQRMSSSLPDLGSDALPGSLPVHRLLEKGQPTVSLESLYADV